MERIALFLSYWKQIVNRAACAATKAVDVRVQTISSWALLVILFGLSYGASNNFFSSADVEWLRNNVIGALARLILAAMVTWLTFFVVYLAYQPAVLDDEKESEIKIREDQITKLKAIYEPDPLLVNFQYERFDNDRLDWRAIIQIKSDLKLEITQFTVELVKLVSITTLGERTEEKIRRADRRFQKGIFTVENIMPQDGSILVHIAQVIEEPNLTQTVVLLINEPIPFSTFERTPREGTPGIIHYVLNLEVELKITGVVELPIDGIMVKHRILTPNTKWLIHYEQKPTQIIQFDSSSVLVPGTQSPSFIQIERIPDDQTKTENDQAQATR